MLDFHSHILPEIDDGAKDVEESCAMLSMLKEQGVTTVALTPHYIAMDESPREFLENRQKSFEILSSEIECCSGSLPKLLLGAEVYYYPGISKMEDLSTLTLEGTNLLLLEMPMTTWGEYAFREIEEIINTSSLTVVLAHIERYFKYIKKNDIERLLDMGALLQVNASFFFARSTKRRALKMFKNGYLSFIGSDCHSTKHRPPRIGEAIDVIKDKFGQQSVEDFFNKQKDYLNF